MREVKNFGWLVTLVYIEIENPNINLQRVRDRVKVGGHDVPGAG